MMDNIIKDRVYEVRFEINGFGHYKDQEDQSRRWIRDIYLHFDENGNLINVDPNMKLNTEQKEEFRKKIMEIVDEYLKFDEFEDFDED